MNFYNCNCICVLLLYIDRVYSIMYIYKGKVIPLQVPYGPEGE